MRYGRKIRRNPDNWYASFTEDGDRWYIGPVSMEEANDRAAFFETLNKKRVSFGTSKPKNGRHLPSVLPIENVRNLIRQKGLPVPSAGGYSYLSSYRDQKRRNPAASDAQVIKAFTEQKAASSKKLQTDGHRLNGLWMGGNGIAVWEGGKIHFQDLGSKAAQTVQRAVAKEAPRSWIGAGSEWALPRKKNPLSGTYTIMHANPLFKRKPSPKFAVGNAVAFKSGGAVGVVLSKQWWDGAWHYEISWPKGYSSSGTTTEHEGNLRHVQRNPDLSGPLVITHNGPDLQITHKANPHRSRSVASKISSSRIPWRTMTSAEIEAVVQEAAAAGDKKLLSRYRRHKKR